MFSYEALLAKFPEQIHPHATVTVWIRQGQWAHWYLSVTEIAWPRTAQLMVFKAFQVSWPEHSWMSRRDSKWSLSSRVFFFGHLKLPSLFRALNRLWMKMPVKLECWGVINERENIVKGQAIDRISWKGMTSRMTRSLHNSMWWIAVFSSKAFLAIPPFVYWQISLEK